MTIEVMSDAFEHKGTIPEQYTCEGAGVSPPLTWTDIPEGTKSFVVLCEDPDAPGGTFKHWAAFDIPADTTSLEAGVPPEPETSGFCQGRNDFEDVGFGAPCPPPGDDAHRYQFHVLAVDTDELDVNPGADYETIKQAARDHALDTGVLTGLYER